MNVLIKNLGNGIKNVTINDPKTYNSLSFATLKSLLNTFKKLDKDNSTKVIILEGAWLPLRLLILRHRFTANEGADHRIHRLRLFLLHPVRHPGQVPNSEIFHIVAGSQRGAFI